ncbi:MAG: hypothetical protein IT158_07175 [Bryobacterales bacterium]|nr:hypothetical protein [Bryobacterales bacterium]
MLRCVKPGCPAACGTRRDPSCRERLLYCLVLAALAIVLLASFAAGVRRLAKRGDLHAYAFRPPAGEIHGKTASGHAADAGG